MTTISNALLIVISIFAFFGVCSFACTMAFVILALSERRCTESRWSKKVWNHEIDHDYIHDAINTGDSTQVY